ncbi:endo-beta-N-acetylglucosaminidase [uncultured Coprobacter sp.]|uniref:endo-beta-N-acetylglucosaminidase n=1 Tax=uncultured Coprobacter sp. TaxID=1720550 RepID=UPI002609DC6C|nr:endo-beta-N-acetylglucosaminidase [uncultured Coprobacter sp.]
MKKRHLIIGAMVCCAVMGTPGTAMSQMSETTTSEVYDFSGFVDVDLMELFYNALQEGRNYPTEEEFAAKGILPSDIAFIRSHVRKAQIIDRANRLLPDTYEKRDLWMNIPMSTGKDGAVGQPTTNFADDVFSMWNYTNLFGSWNHSFFTAPGAWVDAAHKNGTNIMSGIKFFESWGTTSGEWNRIISEKNTDGTFKYVKPMINCLMYFGADGINYNWEDTGYTSETTIAFNKALYKEAAACGFDNFHLGLYTAMSSILGNPNALFGDETGRTAHTMLNYAASDFSYNMGASVRKAEEVMGTSEGLYAGVWIVSMDRGWSRLNATPDDKKCSICLWGEHNASRFWTYNSGADAYEAQSNYQSLLERAFSGGNRNPLNRPEISDTGNNWEKQGDKLPLSTFAGLATWIPERSAIQGNLPFATYFNLGNGDRYNYKGKKTAGAWYNMANQDRVPTYRWLVTEPGTLTASDKIQPEFSHDDSYTGGSCLKLTGEATSTGTDIVLFQTALTSSASGAYANIAVKSGKDGNNATNLYVILKKQDGTWLEFPVGETTGKTWQEKKISLSGINQGDVIERIGLRVKGSDDNYKLYVGKLEINDNVKAVPANVQDVVVEVKEETKTSLSIKANWKLDRAAEDRAAWDLLFNDEANVDHFEILYKNGEEGRISEIARTTQWAVYVGDIIFEDADDQPFIGVRAVSTDLKTYSPIEWVEVARADQDALPVRNDDSYGISQMDPNCEGADIARQQRYVTDFTTVGATQNIEYHANGPQTDGTQYVNATDKVLKVEQGQEVTLTIKCADFSDGLKYCFAGGWMDLDGSGTFNPDPIDENPAQGERLFRLGKLRDQTPEFQTTGITHKFTVPVDARPGKSRLRIVFSDAWFEGSFLPTGLHAKGFSIDFGVEISGDNEPRPAPADNHDQGTPEEPEGLDQTPEGINNVNSEVSSFYVADNVINFVNVDKAWIYSVDGGLVKYLTNPDKYSVADFANGAYIVRMQYGKVIRSGKFVK